LKRRVILHGKAVPGEWLPVGLYPTARQAAEAVADRVTGYAEWVDSPRTGRRSDYTLESWMKYRA
jgi:hypothetical protein